MAQIACENPFVFHLSTSILCSYASISLHFIFNTFQFASFFDSSAVAFYGNDNNSDIK